MKNSTQTRTKQEVVASIMALDLGPIKFKLMDKEEGHGWTRAQADHMEIEYKRFLTLLAKYPQSSIAPSKTVDKFWHAHILDTLKYAEDCDKTFGFFLHHFPYFGMRGAEDAANLAAAAVTTQQLYEQEFGASHAEATSFCGATNTAGFCGATNTASFCGATTSDTHQGVSKEAAEAAFCGATNNASFCGATNTASFCGATNSVSFCGATNSVSFCGATTSDKLAGAESSFCGALDIDTADSILNVSMRPALPIE